MHSRRSLRGAVAGLAVLAVTGALGTTVAAGPASSATTAGCPTAYPVADLGQLVKGDPVHGSTVSSGTTPDAFTGTFIGVLEDGIAPGVPMILVDLSSPEIDRVGGIWEGMSGSPVYTADGRLLGAVAYGLSNGPSPVAGVTPAEDMQQLFAGSGAPTPAAARKVRLSRTLASRVVATGDATAAQVSDGYTQLRVPMVVSGMQGAHRRHDLARGLGMSGRVLAGSSSSQAAPTYPIVPGGNLAASVSYGEVTAAAIGTVTEVCNSQVIGFGHPFMFSGRTSYALQGADAIYIQEDSLGAPFKLANIGAPVGTISGDHLAGIAGALGATPRTDTATSTTTVGGHTFTGTSHIAVPDATPDLATATMVADQDRVLDYVGAGSGRVWWTIKGTRSDGTRFQLTRSDLYSSPYDISYETAGELSNELYQIYGAARLRITSVTTHSVLSDRAVQYRIRSVQVRVHRHWQPLMNGGMLVARAGTTRKLRVQLGSPDVAPRTVMVRLAIPARAARSNGLLTVVGGGNDEGGEVYVDLGGGPSGGGLASVLHRIRTQPHHGDVIAQVVLHRRGFVRHVQGRASSGHVVRGSRTFLLHISR